jgi:NAD(P)H-flavin reductase
MAYQEKFKEWESAGVKVVPVLSQPDDGWKGETGYVQAAFARAKQLSAPKATGAVLCGQKQMAEVCTVFVYENLNALEDVYLYHCFDLYCCRR